jgi:hypothetical protein
VKVIESKKPHKLLILGDSILKGSAELVRSLIGEKYNVSSVVKPGADP